MRPHSNTVSGHWNRTFFKTPTRVTIFRNSSCSAVMWQVKPWLWSFGTLYSPLPQKSHQPPKTHTHTHTNTQRLSGACCAGYCSEWRATVRPAVLQTHETTAQTPHSLFFVPATLGRTALISRAQDPWSSTLILRAIGEAHNHIVMMQGYINEKSVLYLSELPKKKKTLHIWTLFRHLRQIPMLLNTKYHSKCHLCSETAGAFMRTNFTFLSLFCGYF